MRRILPALLLLSLCRVVADEVRLTWIANTETNIDHYRIEAVDSEGESRFSTFDSTNGVIELEPGRTYTITKFAVNVFGLETAAETTYAMPHDLILMSANSIGGSSREVLRLPMTNGGQFFWWASTMPHAAPSTNKVRATTRTVVPAPPIPGDW